MAITDKERHSLRAARDLADEVERLRDNIKELDAHTVSSPNMDGMPKGTGDGDAATRRVIRRDALADKLRRAEAALSRHRQTGRRALEGERAPMRMFCEAFYLDAKTLDDAIAYARIGRRTAERYCAEINKA